MKYIKRGLPSKKKLIAELREHVGDNAVIFLPGSLSIEYGDVLLSFKAVHYALKKYGTDKLYQEIGDRIALDIQQTAEQLGIDVDIDNNPESVIATFPIKDLYYMFQTL